MYIIYWVISKLFPNSKDWGIILWILAIVGIPIVIIFILAIVAAFIFGMAGSSTAPEQTIEQITYQTIQTVSTLPPTPIAPSIKINSAGQSSWIKYTNYDDHSAFTNLLIGMWQK